jgi:amino acid permease
VRMTTTKAYRASDEAVNMDQPLATGELKRGLQNRHIQLIALGGRLGTLVAQWERLSELSARSH